MMNEEGFYIAKSGRKYRSPPGRPLRDEPTDPDLVLEIIRLRDEEKLRWREIAKIYGLSRQAPFLFYKRWKLWAALQKNGE